MASVRNLKDTAIADETDEKGVPVFPKMSGAAVKKAAASKNTPRDRDPGPCQESTPRPPSPSPAATDGD